MKKLPKLLIIAGPTGVGKSSFALDFAKRYQGEIVSADSVQVYRGLDIGSAKPTAQERAQVPHHMIDCIDPNDDYNAADFMRDAGRVIEDVWRRGRLPIVVGGTNLYIRILTYGITKAAPASQKLRQRHREEVEKYGAQFLHDKLRALDPTLAARVHPNDVVRVSRGLEVYELTGRLMSDWQGEHQFSHPRYDALILAFCRPRDELYARIDRRVDEMLRQGLYTEWKELVARGVDPQGMALGSIGYRHMAMYDRATHDADRDEAIRLMKRDTRRFAKQQLSWLRNDPRTRWFELPNDAPLATAAAVEFLSLDAD